MANKRVDIEPTGTFLDEAGLISFRLLQPALVEELRTIAVNQTLILMTALGAKTDDVEYYRAHALAALYAAADGLPGDLCDSRAISYKRQTKRVRGENPTNDARSTYRRIMDKGLDR